MTGQPSKSNSEHVLHASFQIPIARFEVNQGNKLHVKPMAPQSFLSLPGISICYMPFLGQLSLKTV
jgi:hypothetical protein